MIVLRPKKFSALSMLALAIYDHENSKLNTHLSPNERRLLAMEQVVKEIVRERTFCQKVASWFSWRKSNG